MRSLWACVFILEISTIANKYTATKSLKQLIQFVQMFIESKGNFRNMALFSNQILYVYSHSNPKLPTLPLSPSIVDSYRSYHSYSY
jgi:hypothetical protein